MRFTTTIASLLTVGMAAALSRRACAAQNILDACLASMTPQLKACEPNDWSCLCDQSNNVLTCYNNCPGDDNQFGAQQTKTSYCNAAKAYATTTTTTGISITSSQSATATSSEASASASETSSDSSTSSSSTSISSFAQSTSAGAAAAAMTAGVHVQGGLVAALALGLGVVL